MHRGDVIAGRYHLIERLGEGGFGEVWKAEERVAGQTITFVAIKLLSGQVDLREMQLLAHLSHNHILKYMGTVENNGKIYLVTELADSDAGSLIQEGRGVPEEKVEWIIRHSADALRYLHGMNVVHRDIKPGNIMLVGDVAKLGDVGISKVLAASIGSHSGKMTFGYAAPEMFKGTVGYKSDVYSLGITAYQLLTGKLPFEGTAEMLMMAHINQPPDLPYWLSDRWKRALMCCLEKDPDARWSAGQLYEHLLPSFGRADIPVRQATPPTVKMETPPTVKIETPTPPPQKLTGKVETPPPSGRANIPVRNILRRHLTVIESVVISPNGRTVAIVTKDKTLDVLDSKTGHWVKTLRGHSGWITSVNFSSDGSTIVSGSYDKTIKLWDFNTGRMIRTLGGKFLGYIGRAPSDWDLSVEFSPDGTMIVSGSNNNTIKLWEVSTGRCIKTLKEHLDLVNSVGFSPNGSVIVSGSGDKTVKLWNVSTGDCIKTFRGHSSGVQSAGFSPDGRTIVSGSYDKTVKLWDVSDGKCLETLTGHTFGVNSVGFSPDGSTIVSGSYDKTVKLWDVSDGKCIETLTGHSGCVYSVCFSPDGKYIVSGSGDGTVKLWGPLR